MKLTKIVGLLYFAIVITGCANISEEKCREDAKNAFNDFCIKGLLLAPTLDPNEPSYDLPMSSCIRYSYRLSQCKK